MPRPTAVRRAPLTSAADASSGRPIGRSAEIREIEAFLDRASVGLAALTLEGLPGIGKSRLWRYGLRLAEARRMRMLVARPAAADAAFEFGGLTDLFSDVPDDAFGALPRVQRGALDIALLRASADVGLEGEARADVVDERVLAAAVLSLLRLLARETPVVVAFDDLQWLDPRSARLLGFAARRPERDRVGFLLTRRLDGTTADRAGEAADRAIVACGLRRPTRNQAARSTPTSSSTPSTRRVCIARSHPSGRAIQTRASSEANQHRYSSRASLAETISPSRTVILPRIATTARSEGGLRALMGTSSVRRFRRGLNARCPGDRRHERVSVRALGHHRRGGRRVTRASAALGEVVQHDLANVRLVQGIVGPQRVLDAGCGICCTNRPEAKLAGIMVGPVQGAGEAQDCAQRRDSATACETRDARMIDTRLLG